MTELSPTARWEQWINLIWLYLIMHAVQLPCKSAAGIPYIHR